ncbi:unannotated protein [freshwater metagenome]|uniref:Unannotated protein n=1 Tax=freshwater metagenome TaxID=449393 RepID=A0A6J7IPZ5_9ZZZZ
MPGDAPGDVPAHDEQPHHAGHQLDEGEDGHQVRARGQQLGETHGEEVGPRVRVAVGGDLAGLHEDHAEALDEDDGFDEVRRTEVRAGEPGQPLGGAWVVALADDDQGGDADDGAQAQQLVDQVVDGGVTDQRPVEFGIERLPVGLEPDDRAEHEADHHQPVRPADGAELVHPRVRGELHHHLLEAGDERTQARPVRLAQRDRAHHQDGAAEEVRPTHDAEQRTHGAQRDRQRVHDAAFRSTAGPPSCSPDRPRVDARGCPATSVRWAFATEE